MKLHTLIFSLFILALLFTACDDDIKSVGLGTRPESDKISVYSDTIFLGEEFTTTVQAGPVLINPTVTGFASNAEGARSSSFLLGNFYDQFYGNLKADFITSFYPEDELFPSTFIRIDTIKLTFSYYSWVGDSLTPMVVNVYPAKKEIHNIAYKNYTNTSIDLNSYAENVRWGAKSYTARDLSIPDSVYYYNSASSPVNMLSFDITNCLMPTTGKSVLESFQNEWNNNKSTFQSIKRFSDFFPGIYAKTTAGIGNLLKIHDVSLSFQYSYSIEDEEEATGYAYIGISNDILQSCQYQEGNQQFEFNLLNQEASYIKSPAGAYTQYTIPISEIKEKLDGREVNTVKLALHAYPKEEGRYALNAPGTLLLIRTDSIESFFEKSQNVTAPYSYKATYSNYTYNFGDISGLIREGLKEDNPQNITVQLIPIAEQIDIIDQQYPIVRKTAYDITPSGVKLRTDKKHLRLEIISSEIYK